MCKAQNKNMERKRKQGNTTPQKANNNTIDLMKREGNGSQLLTSEE
jgi:hypothetical protein